MKLLKQGAEAKLFSDKIDNKDVVVKHRIEKKYRIPQIDDKIRKYRTSLEYNLLVAARRNGILTATIIDVDEKQCKIVMEKIPGELVKELLYVANKAKIVETSLNIGKIVGKLHSAGIIHGDLTTSNMIIKKEDIYLIDFGLGFFSRKIEDQGVDLRLFREALKSTHFNISEISWENFLKGYKKEYKDAELVIKKVNEIERRARYSQRES